MKIKIDLGNPVLLDNPEILRSAAVAILSALPSDEAELAVEEWQAVNYVRQRDAAAETDTPPFGFADAKAAGGDFNALEDIKNYKAAEVKVAATVAAPEPETQAQPSAQEAGSTTTPPAKGGAPMVGATTRLEDIKLSTRTRNASIKGGFVTLGSFAGKDPKFLLGMDGFGQKALGEIRYYMEAAGLEFGDFASGPQADQDLTGTEVEPEAEAEAQGVEPTPAPEAQAQTNGASKPAGTLDLGSMPIGPLMRKAEDHLTFEGLTAVAKEFKAANGIDVPIGQMSLEHIEAFRKLLITKIQPTPA